MIIKLLILRWSQLPTNGFGIETIDANKTCETNSLWNEPSTPSTWYSLLSVVPEMLLVNIMQQIKLQSSGWVSS